jgi:antibiotic biosynthesis monooxygenase (ABM) superfamily enzyme
MPEYASTVSISIVMIMSFHVMPFKKRFLKKWFSSQISSKPPSPQETEHRKKEEK